MPDITLLPSAKVPLIYSDTNGMTTEWYRFFWNVYGFTGSPTGAVPVNRGGTGLTTIGEHQIIIGNANNVYEPALMRGFGINVTYEPGFVNFALGASGVTPGTYGNASTVGQFTIDQYGVITFANNVPIAIDSSQIISGTIASARISGAYTGITGVGVLTAGTWNATTIDTAYGGTGLTSFTSGGALYATSTSTLTSGTLPVTAGGTGQTSYTNGQLLIGNTTGNTLTKATLTAGTAIGITNGAGAITITNTLPDQTVVLSNGTGISVTGTYPSFTITNTAPSSGGTVTSVSGTAPISVATGTTTPVISISQATTSTNGYLSSTDWNTFNNKQPAGSYLTAVSVVSANGFAGTSSGGTTPALTLSTSITGILKGNGTAISAATSGTDYAPATSGTSILYGNGAGGFSNVTIGTGVSFAGGTLSATGSGGTVTSVAALTLGTTGTDLSSTVANGTTTPVITLNVPTASATNRGALSAADWTTFNNKGNGTVTSVAMSVPAFLSVAGSPITTSGTLAVTLSGTALPLANGGTGATSAPAANANLRGWTTTATAAGTTTLTNTSSHQQEFTGTTTQTVVLPVTSTLALGWSFEIINNSTGSLTINSSGGNLVGTLTAGTTASLVCVAITGTTAASWDFDIDGFSAQTGTGSVVRATSPTIASPIITGSTPTVTVYTSGSGTYTTPTNTRWLQIIMVGAGGGGSGGKTGSAGGAGGDTTFGSNTAGGGGAGGTFGGQGTGGTATLSGATGLSLVGGFGAGGPFFASAGNYWPGGSGGASALGGLGTSSSAGAQAGKANTGGGGGGGVCNNISSEWAGGGGGGGGFINATITSPAATYSYAIGAGGSSGAAGGAGGTAGATGGSGVIYVIAYL